MNQVLDWLYVGSLDDAENYERLKEAGIEALLSLAYPVKHPDILISYVPFDDGEPIPEEVLYKALSFVRRKHREGRKILIACSAGVSRSPTIAIAVLHELVGYPLVEAFRTVIHQVHSAYPHPTLWPTLCRYYGQSVGVNDVWRRESTSDDTGVSVTDARRNWANDHIGLRTTGLEVTHTGRPPRDGALAQLPGAGARSRARA